MHNVHVNLLTNCTNDGSLLIPTNSGLFHPMGALLYSNETYTETLPIVDASGLPSYPFSYTVKGWLFDWTDGTVIQAPASPDQLYPLIEADVERFITYWETEFAPNLTTIGYKVCMGYVLLNRVPYNTVLTRVFRMEFRRSSPCHFRNGYRRTGTTPRCFPRSFSKACANFIVFDEYHGLMRIVVGMVPYGYGSIDETPAVGTL